MKVDFDKGNGLVPAIVQDFETRNVLMLGYMNEESLQKTISSGRVTFYSRSKKRLWTKGEESGNYLELIDWKLDCDNDTILVRVKPNGPTCHKGTDTCWSEENVSDYGFISKLEAVIEDRIQNPKQGSYTSDLIKSGINKVAQKVGEEGVEVVIEAMDNNDDLFLNESADLLYHYLILLQAKGYKLKDVVSILESRH